jgi:hypothetical protein
VKRGKGEKSVKISRVGKTIYLTDQKVLFGKEGDDWIKDLTEFPAVFNGFI